MVQGAPHSPLHVPQNAAVQPDVLQQPPMLQLASSAVGLLLPRLCQTNQHLPCLHSTAPSCTRNVRGVVHLNLSGAQNVSDVTTQLGTA
jgi:hypothetical protein